MVRLVSNPINRDEKRVNKSSLNKIDEIQSKGTISITDAQDLANLKAQNAELEAEIKNQETLNKINAEATSSKASIK